MLLLVFNLTKRLFTVLLLPLYIGLQAVRFIDDGVTFVMHHRAVRALFRSWTFLVTVSYLWVIPESFLQSTLFRQMDALIWILRTAEICWTIPKIFIHSTVWCIKSDLHKTSFSEVKAVLCSFKLRSIRKQRLLSITSFSDVKQCIYFTVVLYCVFTMPLASAGTTNCPMFTEKMGAGRWFQFYGAFRAYLIRQDIYVFDEKDPNNLIKKYPETGDKDSIQYLTDRKVSNSAQLNCVDMKAKSLLAEATMAYSAVCITVMNSETYAESIQKCQLLLMGQREATIALHR